MEILTDVQGRCYDTVASWLTELVGEQAQPHPDVPQFGVWAEKSLIQIGVLPRGLEDAMVSAVSVVVHGPRTDPDLLGFLLGMNYRMLFGAFTMAENGDVLFEYRMPAEGLTKQTLKTMLSAARSTVGETAPTIIERWGGQRTADWLLTHAADTDGSDPSDG